MTRMPSPPRFPPPRPDDAAGWTTVSVVRLRGDEPIAEDDRVAVEAPLEIRVGDRPFTVVMRTPGQDEELVAGFLYSEGVVRQAGDIRSLAHPESLLDGDCENVVRVDLAEGAALADRAFYASASCGVCGKSSIADLAIRAPAIDSALRVDRRVLVELPERLRREQSIFAATGGLHGAALFDAEGTLLAAREDIGRHNAVDKLIGWAMGAGRLPLSTSLLVVSGRLGFEIVQKAIVAGLPWIASVGAASSIAVALAERYGVMLATFVRPEGLNLYGDPARLLGVSERGSGRARG